MTRISDRLSVEGPDEQGRWVIEDHQRGFAFTLTRSEADALILPLRVPEALRCPAHGSDAEYCARVGCPHAKAHIEKQMALRQTEETQP